MPSVKNYPLPTFQGPIPPEIQQADAIQTADEWLGKFKTWLKKGEFDDKGVNDLWIENGFWRDILALTWDFR
jgi:hypothetical protein